MNENDEIAIEEGSTNVYADLGYADAAEMQRKRLAAVWAERAPGVPLKSADEALILASIVEKETGRASDRGLIAGVFSNRLRIGMPLQTDPSVIYGLGEAFDATCASAICRPTRPSTPTPAMACRPRRLPCRGWPRCARPCSPRPPRRCTLWRGATAAASSAMTWPRTIGR